MTKVKAKTYHLAHTILTDIVVANPDDQEPLKSALEFLHNRRLQALGNEYVIPTQSVLAITPHYQKTMDEAKTISTDPNFNSK